MQFIYDNLVAVIVTMSLTVSLLSQQTNVRRESLERQSVYDAKVKALSFAEWLEDDVVNLGARFGRSRDRFRDSTVTRDGQRTTVKFEYYYNERTINEDVVQRVEVRYLLASGGSVYAGRDGAGHAVTVPLYRLTRHQRSGNWKTYPDGRTDWVGGTAPAWARTPGYGSPPGLRRFLIEPLDSEGRVVTDPLLADYVRVQFAVVPTMFPLHRAQLIKGDGLFWGTTVEIRPF